ncbi:MAG: beta-galactosidase [Treponema sp.]|jgi:beta-galactosidase|nr:beta-galactosidase [Treponema sp.]
MSANVKRYPPIVEKVPHFLHGGDYNPDQWIRWKDKIWKEDMRLAKLAGINTLSVGIFSWAALEPEEGKYNFNWLDEIMDMMAENGITAVLATPSGARPAWMSQKYPEILRVNRDRSKNLHGGRHNHCLTSPLYREKTTAINTALAERYKNHSALGVWHISNEYGGECHCPLCQERFRAYVKDRYQNLDDLNEAWWSRFWAKTFTDWSQIESPSPLGETCIHGLNLDWMRFTTEQFVDFFLCETKPLKTITPKVPCTTNLMGTYPGFDSFRMAQVLDVVSWDNYPQWTGTEKDVEIGIEASFIHDMNRSFKGKPFMLMESSPSATNWRPVAKLHRPNVHMLQSMQAVAHGSDTVQYFQFRKGRGSAEKFHGAVVDHEGSENTRVFRDVAEVGKRLAGMDAIVGTGTPAETAIVYDWQNRWALDDVHAFLQDKTGYFNTIKQHYKFFWQHGVPVDIIDSSLIAQPGYLDKYRLLAAPMLYMLRPGVAEAIAGFVRKGGTFAATYITGQVDENDLCFTGGFPGPLRETLGIWCEEVDALYPEDRNSLIWNGKSYKAFDLCELIHAERAEVLGTYGSDFYAGQPALTVNKIGSGKSYFIAARTGEDFLNDFYTALIGEAGIKRLLEAELPKGLSAQVRSDGKTDYIFIMNFTPSETKVDCGKEGVKKLAPYECVIVERRHID